MPGVIAPGSVVEARRLARTTDPRDAFAVTIHDVEPATWQRCALLRDWLADLGVLRVTLLVVPASDLHPFDRRSPALRAWLEERLDAGDEIAQNGFRHETGGALRASRGPGAAGRRSSTAEFAGLSAEETARAVDAGRRILAAAGITVRGFVAPGFAYTPELRASLASRFAWWATADALHGAPRTDATHEAPPTADARRAVPTAAAVPTTSVVPSLRSAALCFGASRPAGRGGSPMLVRVASRIARGPVRLELHPGDVAHPARIAAAEAVLRRHVHRRTITCGELVAR